jgi:rubrerythrin
MASEPHASLQMFLAHAVALEEEAAERYDELSAVMETHHNEVSELFRRMADYSRLHRAEAEARAHASPGELPALKPWEFSWPEAESPESAAMANAHYLMGPHEALQLALAAEHRAHAFYRAVAEAAADPALTALAAEFAAEEAGHADLLEDWIRRTPPDPAPPGGDLDPPVAVD